MTKTRKKKIVFDKNCSVSKHWMEYTLWHWPISVLYRPLDQQQNGQADEANQDTASGDLSAAANSADAETPHREWVACCMRCHWFWDGSRDADFPLFLLFLARSVLYFLLFHLSLSACLLLCSFSVRRHAHVDFQLFSQKSSGIPVDLKDDEGHILRMKEEKCMCMFMHFCMHACFR